MKLKDIMTKNIASVNTTSTVEEVAKLMQKYNVGSVPVCEQDKLVGIVTDRDIIMKNIASGNSPSNTSVRNIMTSNITTATPDMDMSEAYKLMSDHQIRRLPVVENNKLIGMVALGDLATSSEKSDIEISKTLSHISEPSQSQSQNI